jgi:predicted nuclease of predicted toxin-antitoxin system
LADEGFNRDIVRGVFSRDPTLVISRVQDVGLSGASDSDILEWAAQAGRIVLTHDENSMLGDATSRLLTGLPMPGVVVVHQDIPMGRAIVGLLELIGTSLEDEWTNQIRYVLRR